MTRPGIFIGAAAAFAVIGFLTFRVLNLEQRVQRLAASSTASGPLSANAGAERVGANENPPSGVEAELQALRKRVDALEQRAAKLSQTGAGTSTPIHDEKAVLSIVERENSRIRDVQLEWHRARWLEARAAQLTAFAAQLKLQPSQTSELQRALELEADSMVSVLKDPSVASDPDQSASDWQALLDRTYDRAKRVLTPEQLTVWSQARSIERRVLWPWLPSLSPSPSPSVPPTR